MKVVDKKRKILRLDASYLPLIFGAAVTVVVVYFVYLQTQSILKERLRQRIESMVSIGALQLNAEDVENVIHNESKLADLVAEATTGSTIKFDLSSIEARVKNEPTLINSPIISLTQQMKKIREAAPNIRYIYIWRKTTQPTTLAFVTDSDTVYPVDWDKNGKIDELELPPMPGEEYDVTDIPEVQEQAFNQPVVMNDFIVDKWGTFLSGFAPIRDSEGNTVAILGMDVNVGDFYQVVNATLLPFSVQGIVLLLLLSFQTLALLRIWKSRVDLLKELDKQKDELLSIVSHQLATPVSAVRWNLEMMLDGDLGKFTNDQEKSLKSLQDITSDLSDLVSMILDVSRIQLGRVTIEKQELNLEEFFKEILEIIVPRAQEKKVKLEVSMPAQFPHAILDKRYTHMTIENLLSNAVKYTPENGSVKFDVSVKEGIMYCTVKDTGVGIPKQEQDKIFGKLFRASNVRNTVDGNGFGLYVAKGAIESQGGKIWFESEEGKGTTFFIELPLISNEEVSDEDNKKN